MAEMTGRERELAMDEMVRYVYKKTEVKFRPRYPWVLVRLLPKSQEYKSLLILPETQNKTMHEGVVLKTWEKRKTDEGEQTSELKGGDHVLFPHYVGLPVLGLDEHLYRVIKEEDAVGVLQHPTQTEDPISKKLSSQFDLICIPSTLVEQVVAYLREQYVMVDRQATSVTLSGI